MPTIVREDPTKVFRVNARRPQKRCVQAAVECLRRGGVVVFPTDTVYGLAARAFDREAVRRIYQLKGRRWTKPLVYFVSSAEQMSSFVEPLSEPVRRLIKRYWPGPLTLIFTASPAGRLLTGGRTTLGVRVPNHPSALALLQALGEPLATTSANRSGEPAANRGSQAVRLFRGLVDLILDGGTTPLQRESTVLDVTTTPWLVVREGAIPKTQL
ncbi:MAG: threonylcarbamoyl-AMP synthase [Elusimicrobia bacterium]|nr:threonylcarbamoyl-AMP synthase [Elusimicrobiota bacterium]